MAYDALAKLLIGATAVGFLTWAMLQRMDGSTTAWAADGSHVASTATNAVNGYLRHAHLQPALQVSLSLTSLRIHSQHDLGFTGLSVAN